MEKEIKHKGKVITKKHPSGMFEYYSDKQKRFLKFDKLESAKSSIDKESKEDVRESVKAKTKKITLTELRSLVKKIIKEEQSKKTVIKENKITPQLNDKITKIAQEKYKKNNGKTKEDFDSVYDETIKEFGYEPKFFRSYMEKYFTPFEDGDFMQESVKPKTQKIKLSEVRQLVKKMIKEEYNITKEFSDAIDSLTDDLEVRDAAKKFAWYKIHKKGTDPLKNLSDDIYHKALDVYRNAKNI